MNSGILNTKPTPFAIADATTSGAIDTFVKCVALEMPRNTRINVINPTVLTEAWDVYGEMMPGFEPVRVDWWVKRLNVRWMGLFQVRLFLWMLRV